MKLTGTVCEASLTKDSRVAKVVKVAGQGVLGQLRSLCLLSSEQRRPRGRSHGDLQFLTRAASFPARFIFSVRSMSSTSLMAERGKRAQEIIPSPPVCVHLFLLKGWHSSKYSHLIALSALMIITFTLNVEQHQYWYTNNLHLPASGFN